MESSPCPRPLRTPSPRPSMMRPAPGRTPTGPHRSAPGPHVPATLQAATAQVADQYPDLAVTDCSAAGLRLFAQFPRTRQNLVLDIPDRDRADRRIHPLAVLQ